MGEKAKTEGAMTEAAGGDVATQAASLAPATPPRAESLAPATPPRAERLAPATPLPATPPPATPLPVGLSADELKTYDRLRRKIQETARSKAGPKYGKAVELLLFLPDFVVLIFRLLKDPRVPATAKAKLGLFVVYLVSPIDVIPDFIPVLGQMDDLVGAVLVVRDILKSTSQEVVLELWSGQGDVIKTITVVLDVAGEILGKNALKAIAKCFSKEK